MTLKNSIISQIKQTGPIGIDQYMSLCLGHPEHGYYMKQDPFGASGDFTTAPEISQLYGDMIGLWVLNTYMRLERPMDLTIIECGPGRGTLMSDILRIACQDATFKQAVNVHMVETSPVLQKLQQSALAYTADISCQWHTSLGSIETKGPVIIIANEFFDALPFKQYQFFAEKGWHEVVIGIDETGNNLRYGVTKAPDLTNALEQYDLSPPEDKDIFEIAPVREMIALQMANMIEKSGGSVLTIDYGHVKSDYGDTFQALYKHDYADPLKNCGDADLTSHVDFAQLARRIATETKTQLMPLTTQKDFLVSLGIELWHEKLSLGLQDMDDIKQLEAQKNKLINTDEMGDLFKILCFENI